MYAIALCLACNGLLHAQSNPLLKVHFDPNTTPLPGENFVRSELRFIHYALNRDSADIQVQLMEEPIGNGSRRYRFFFFGQGAFEGRRDTVVWYTEPNENAGSIREKALFHLKRGLLPYLLQTPLEAAVDYTISPDVADNSQWGDPWKLLTLQPNLQVSSLGNYAKQGATSVKNYNYALSVGMNAWKITPKNRMNAGLSYDYEDKGSETATRRSQVSLHKLEMNVGYAFALGEQWSAGGSLDAGFWNAQIQPGDVKNDEGYLRPRVGVEYSFYPYEQFFRRRLTVSAYADWVYTLLPPSERVPVSIGSGVQYARVGRWGFITASGYAGTNLSRDRRTWSSGADASLGINAGRNIFLAFSARLNLNTAQAPGSPQQINLTQQSLLHLYYFFGSGYRNIINPRMWGGASI